jgi:hypothetical protein
MRWHDVSHFPTVSLNASRVLIQGLNSRYYTWVKHVENSKAASKPTPQAQSLNDVERGRDREEHGLVTIFENKDEGDEEPVTLGHWSDSRKSTDKA